MRPEISGLQELPNCDLIQPSTAEEAALHGSPTLPFLETELLMTQVFQWNDGQQKVKTITGRSGGSKGRDL